ncbi:MAG: arginine--tRNA ligase [Patescibacteria group bacterium]
MIKEKLQQLTGAEVTKPKPEFGDYAVFVGKEAQALSEKLKAQSIPEIEKIEVKGQYINFFLSSAYVQQQLYSDFAFDPYLKDKTIIVEYTDPNPFKLFHIGHLMSNAIGESIARLYEASGAKVIRVTWQGDVGMHIAKAVWADGDYAAGAKAFDEDPKAKQEIEAINKKIYDRSDLEINKRYDEGRKASLEYFEKEYERLGSKFDRYFFESEEGPKGLALVKAHPEVFVPSEGAIVFHGEHTRVFVNSQGLPTYEAKELGLNQEKFKLYHPDLSVIVTGNEIKEYFHVLMEAMKLVMPDVAEKTRHVPHGMLRLPTGKMSSRTGDVITADELIEEVREKTKSEEVATGAIKYAILKQGIGNDIIFDREKSIAVHGDTGVYLQYTYARLISILTKSGISNFQFPISNEFLNEKNELNIIKHLIEFPDAVREATERIAPNIMALYCYELANLANRYYEEVRILDDINEDRKQARLVLVRTVADILKRGLGLLGIAAPERI